MSFISIEFILFAALVVPLYFWMRFRLRWLLLLGASYVFYAYWKPEYVLLIVFSTVVDYLAAIALQRSPSHRKLQRRLLLMCSVAANLSVLFFFKYADFLSQTVAGFAEVLGASWQFKSLELLLPVGISFYTFQSMAYTFDVYRGRLQAENHFGIFATYVAFFPQLVAGPIERATNMLPQFRQKYSFDYARVVGGLRLVLWGAFKKVVVADRLAIYVNAVYGDVESYSGMSLIVATFFFAFQIYCDFSAYSDIAVGVARVLGFKLMENFRRPYLATSLRDFWRRWHISLSTWFRDYVYIGLGGNRKGLGRQLWNLLFVFALSGLWHGANWTFLLWGLYHGILVALEVLGRARIASRLPHGGFGYACSLICTFLLVTAGWVLFRASSLSDISYIVLHMLDFSRGFAALTDPSEGGILPQRVEFLLSFLLIALALFVDVLDERIGLMTYFATLPVLLRWLVYYFLVTCIILTSFFSTAYEEFIYFQF